MAIPVAMPPPTTPPTAARPEVMPAADSPPTVPAAETVATEPVIPAPAPMPAAIFSSVSMLSLVSGQLKRHLQGLELLPPYPGSHSTTYYTSKSC